MAKEMDVDDFVSDAPHTEHEGPIGTDPTDAAKPEETKPETVQDSKPEIPVKTEPVVKATEPEKPVEPKPEKSYLLDVQKQTVPVPVVADLRAKIRERDARLADQEQRIKDLEQASQSDSIAGIADDDMVTGAQLKQFVQQQRNAEVQRHQIGLQREREQRMAEFGQFVKASEIEARKNHTDYDQIVGTAVEAGMITEQDNAAALQSPNPAEFIYQRVQRKRAFFGITPVVPGEKPAETPKEKPLETPQPEKSGVDPFEEVFAPHV